MAEVRDPNNLRKASEVENINKPIEAKTVVGKSLGENVSPIVDDENIVVNEEIKESKNLFSIKDLIDALSIIISTGQTITMTTRPELIVVLNMHAEKPAEIETYPIELNFLYDLAGEWCLGVGRQRVLKEKSNETSTYPGFIKGLHHLIEGTTKEFYRIIRIKRKIIRGAVNIIDPLVIGFPEDVNKIVQDDMSTMIIRNLRVFEPRRFPDRDEIPVVLNPALHGFEDETQAYILNDRLDMRLWMERFAQRKRLVVQFGAGPIYGENNVRWVGHASPRIASRMLSAIPRFNLLSVAYASQFCFPDFALSPIDVTQVSQSLEINSNRAEPLAMVVNSPVTGTNYDDFRKIILAMVLPEQVLIDIEYDKDTNAILSGVSGLMAKMLFSTTPGFRTITMRSALETDVIIGRMLTKWGYMNADQTHPLNVTSPRGGGGAQWLELETREIDGLGWINHRVNGTYDIQNPLYDGVNELPSYAGLNQYIDIQDFMDFNNIPRPPILDAILACLADAVSMRSRADAGQSLVNYLANRWTQFLLNINRFIVEYGETGFRLTDVRKNELENIQTGQYDESFNAPVRLRIQADSIYKFMLRVPSLFSPNNEKIKCVRLFIRIEKCR